MTHHAGMATVSSARSGNSMQTIWVHTDRHMSHVPHQQVAKLITSKQATTRAVAYTTSTTWRANAMHSSQTLMLPQVTRILYNHAAGLKPASVQRQTLQVPLISSVTPFMPTKASTTPLLSEKTRTGSRNSQQALLCNKQSKSVQPPQTFPTHGHTSYITCFTPHVASASGQHNASKAATAHLTLPSAS
jgi:hypothetical protein